MKQTSEELIRQRLQQTPGEWVSAWDLAQLAIEYKRPIHTLRHRFDLNIGNKTERKNRKVYGSYRLLPGSWKELRGQPAPSRPGWKSQDFGFSEKRPAKPAEQEPLFKNHLGAIGL